MGSQICAVSLGSRFANGQRPKCLPSLNALLPTLEGRMSMLGQLCVFC